MAGAYGHSPVRAKAETVILRFVVNVASGVPTISSDPKGVTASIADTGVGVYTVTLDATSSFQAAYGFGSHSAGVDAINVVCTSPTTVAVKSGASGAASDTDGNIDVCVLAERSGE